MKDNFTGGVIVGFDINDYENSTLVHVFKAYLYDEKSHRDIQEFILNILAPVRGGGFVAMDVLHYFNIRADKKGVLNKVSLSEEIRTATGRYKQALELIRDAS